ncbi:MAG: hypothetical protein ACHQX3_00575 [Nitrospirales bacterium]|jgi:hypothetical protein
MAKTIKAAGLPVTAAEAKMIAEALRTLRPGGVAPQPKEKDKPKFRNPVHPRRAALPGEAQELRASYRFRALCRAANISPTRRQASKYIGKRGDAFNFEKRNPRWEEAR